MYILYIVSMVYAPELHREIVSSWSIPNNKLASDQISDSCIGFVDVGVQIPLHMRCSHQEMCKIIDRRIFDLKIRPQADFKPWIISPKLGLFPYINMYILKILMTMYSPPMMERTNTPMLVKISHSGISVIPNITMV